MPSKVKEAGLLRGYCVVHALDPMSGAEVKRKAFESYTLGLKAARGCAARGFYAKVEIGLEADPMLARPLPF